ncbi:MAG: OmpA family protein [Bacteroidaceae bacterium]|nr:OmpA family protein [Bacteroidaceae bacterium]
MRFNKVVFVILVCIGLWGCHPAKLSTADAQFERGEYFAAADTYRRVYNKTSASKERTLRGRIAYSLGTCYRILNSSPRAAAAYQNAIRYNYPDSTAYLYLATELHKQGKYTDAIKNYEKYLEIVPNDLRATNGLKGCELGLQQKENPTRYVVKKANLFNSRRSECCAMFTLEDESMIYFTSTNDKATGKDKSPITGLKNNDIFFSERNDKGVWSKPIPVEGELNTENDEGIISFSDDGQIMYYSLAESTNANSDTYVSIYQSTRSDATWKKGEKVAITIDSTIICAHPAVMPGTDWLYFTSDMPGGYGGKDIWRVSLKDMTELENLGPEVNTPYDEVFPFVRKNGDLYFSSNGHPGLGGLDVFLAYKDEIGNWHRRNMGAPINSPADDFGIMFMASERGYLSSNRNDARGYDHIYTFELPQIEVWIEGYVVDYDDEPLPGAVIRIVGRDGTNLKEFAQDDGYFKFPLDLNTDYVMMAGCGGYLNSSAELTTLAEEQNETYWVDFVLSSIGKPIPVDDIFFDFNKATLRPESENALNDVIKTLTDNPNITIEMGAHTDFKGSEEYNLTLSQRRAEAVIEYLIKNGISKERLTAKGYGESTPVTITKKLNKLYPQFPEGTILNEEFIMTLPEEDIEIANQINRRTEFRVTAIDAGLL